MDDELSPDKVEARARETARRMLATPKRQKPAGRVSKSRQKSGDNPRGDVQGNGSRDKSNND